MAKYSVTYVCGHEETVQLYGKHADRESKLEWMERTCLCPECYKAEQQASKQKRAEDAAAANVIAGMAELIGSEKQLAWAETIRAGYIHALESTRDRLNNQQRDLAIVLVSTIDWAKSITEAKWWIDNRAQSNNQVAGMMSAMTGTRAPEASENEIIIHMLLLSPHMHSGIAKLLKIEDKWHAMNIKAAEAEAKAEEEQKQIEKLRELEPIKMQARKILGMSGYVKAWRGGTKSSPKWRFYWGRNDCIEFRSTAISEEGRHTIEAKLKSEEERKIAKALWIGMQNAGLTSVEI